MITIVYAHPLEGSLNATIRDELLKHLRSGDIPYHLIDLYKDGFQPAMTSDELRTFFTGDGISGDPLVKSYQDMLRETNHLVVLFPVWFNGEPSIVKGFFERTCLPNFGYAYAKRGTVPLLTHVKRLTVLTTSGAPTLLLSWYFGNMIKKYFIKSLAGTMFGSAKSTWLNFGNALSPSKDDIEAYISKVAKMF
jgi:putative NADPH-quinone reductase